jgi:hypothetical protein
MLRAPASFDGREVIASGVAGNGIHQTDFWDPECSLPKHGGAILLRFADTYKLGKAGDKRYHQMLHKEGAVGVTVKGTFVSTGGPYGPAVQCEFLISSVIEVRKLSKVYRQQFDIGTGKVQLSHY